MHGRRYGIDVYQKEFYGTIVQIIMAQDWTQCLLDYNPYNAPKFFPRLNAFQKVSRGLSTSPIFLLLL